MSSPSYRQYCPITRALDVVGERWSLLIIRDMITGASRFNDLARGLPGLSRSLLSKRLSRLEAAGLIIREEGRYLLTEAGRDLQPVVMALGQWGATWVFGDPRPDELDAELLVWWMHERLDLSAFDGHRHVIHLRFTDDPRLFWIVVEDGAPSVCLSDPGFDVDVTVSSDVATLYQVWLGRIGLKQALSTGRLDLTGSSEMRRRMADVLRLSPVAGMVSAHAPG